MIGPSIKRLADASSARILHRESRTFATLCLQHEYPNLDRLGDAHLVAKRSFDAGDIYGTCTSPTS